LGDFNWVSGMLTWHAGMN